jgi:hypothetical protein
MTTRFSRQTRHHVVAFAFALASTLAIFSGVDRLASPAPDGAVLVQATQSTPRA